jgi:hypothetical protein
MCPVNASDHGLVFFLLTNSEFKGDFDDQTQLFYSHQIRLKSQANATGSQVQFRGVRRSNGVNLNFLLYFLFTISEKGCVERARGVSHNQSRVALTKL